VKTWITIVTFLRFFGNDTSKNVKSRVFWILKKKRKKRILELWRTVPYAYVILLYVNRALSSLYDENKLCVS